MRASDNWLLTGHEGLRASDAERDEAIGELRDRFAEGRLSHETFLYRMDAALRAKDRSELSDLFTDLPDGKRGSRRALADRLARLWRVPRERLNVSLRRPSARPGLVAEIPAPAPAWPASPQSLCLPRQAERRFTIGRAPSCDFTVADLSVSRWHARLHNEDGNWLLSDLGSTNGTRLNGWRVTSAVPVQAGDNVSFGSAAFVIIDRPVAAAHPAGAG